MLNPWNLSVFNTYIYIHIYVYSDQCFVKNLVEPCSLYERIIGLHCQYLPCVVYRRVSDFASN